jgi:hypothetical protein
MGRSFAKPGYSWFSLVASALFATWSQMDYGKIAKVFVK